MVVRFIWVVMALQPSTLPALKIVVIKGEDAVNVIQQRTAVAPIVEVRDRNDVPVSGAVVTFAIQGGKTATFAGGLPAITVTTNAAGQAVASLSPLTSGAVQINVQAAFQGQVAAATITQTNVLTAAQAAALGASGAGSGSTGAATGGGAGGGGGISGTTLGILGAAVAGGAAAATAATGDDKAEISSPPVTLPTPAAVPFSTVDLRVGNGAEATPGRTVIVSYVGWLYDATGPDNKGVQIDASSGLVFVLGSGQFLAGFNQGIAGMRVGGLRRIIIPPNLGYGSQAPAPIPANATLVFEVVLLEVR